MSSNPDRLRPAEPNGRAYGDPDVLRMLDQRASGHREVPKTRQVYVNRNLRMDKIELVGFDMDYTLAIYHLRRIEELSFDMTVKRMVEFKGYPQSVATVKYDPDFVIRGLVMDKQTGNIFKMDRFNHCGRCYHGRRPLPVEEMRRLYRDEKIHLSMPRFAWLDTLFALPEACLFAEVIERLESTGEKVDYGKLYDDIRESIDTVHRDNSLKTELRKDLARFILKDAELGPALHKLRSGGKKLFLLTNSLVDYTDAVMRFILDGILPEYPSWRNYFDYVITGSGKPGFFSDKRPFMEVALDGKHLGEAKSLERGRLYEGGNLVDLEKMVGIGGDRVLYVGDHIYGDILRSKKTSLWRTCMVVQELEDELGWLEKNQVDLDEMTALENLRTRLDDEVGQRKTALNALDRRLGREDLPPEVRAASEEDRKSQKGELEKLRRAMRDANGRIEELEQKVELGFNRYWGLIFKEGNENSRFGEQVEDYACLYTSRASNFVFYSPMQYFRSWRAFMPHERIGGKLAPYGEEHAEPAAGARTSKMP
jgi:HAD superfamily 5'-nucleotidase-like hydrolase